MPIMTNQRRKAFADATAGVIGSLATMLAFYPIDVWKTTLQAKSTTTTTTTTATVTAAAPTTSPSTSKTSIDSEHLENTTIAVMVLSLTKLFRGLPYKMAHTIASSFTYFFVYSLLQTKYSAHLSTSNHRRNATMTKLFLTAFAAMINTGITLPLDTISSRRQVALSLLTVKNQRQRQQQQQQEQQQSTLQSILSLWNGLFPAILLCTNPAIQYTLYDMLKMAWLVQRRRYKDTIASASSLVLSSSTTPPILLPSNGLQQQRRRKQHSLTMSEAFIFGIVSKFIATMITYPLIRCKVMLMVSSSTLETTTSTIDPAIAANAAAATTVSSVVSTKSENNDKMTSSENRSGKLNCNSSEGNGDNCLSNVDDSHVQPYNKTLEYKTSKMDHPPSSYHRHHHHHHHHHYTFLSLPHLLLHIYKHDGGLVRGLYRGCYVQLLHTVLKSALLMMVRERITEICHRWFRIEEETML